MNHFTDVKIFQAWRKDLKDSTVGFVPTMGALHKGHLEVIKESQKNCSKTIVSIFVNPTQFNNPEDLEKYPSDLKKDLGLLAELNVDAVFTPQTGDMYPQGETIKITESEISKGLCGRFRPGHFEGVMTVVMKLFQLVQPHKAYFGEKDYQQLLIIQKMAREFFLDLEVVAVPTVREESGLALSSRNVRLSPKDRNKAALIYRFLTTPSTSHEVKANLEGNGFKVDYVEDLYGRRFVAAWLSNIRLIDNVPL